MQTISPDKIAKADMHIHLEGTIHPKRILELAQGNDRRETLPDLSWVQKDTLWDVRDWKDLMTAIGDCCLCTINDYEIVLNDLLQSLRDQGVIYSEINLSLARIDRIGLPAKDVVSKLCQILSTAKAHYGLHAGLLIALDHNSPAETLEKHLTLAIEHLGEGVVGLDLEGAPFTPISNFKDLFARARQEGLGVRAHAGEILGPKSVQQALDSGVNRIAHGIRAFEDPQTVQALKDLAMPLDICISSNCALGIAKTQDHPVRAVFTQKMPFTLGSDDPLYFNCDISKEYRLFQEMTSASIADMTRITLQALQTSFAPKELKSEMISNFPDCSNIAKI